MSFKTIQKTCSSKLLLTGFYSSFCSENQDKVLAIMKHNPSLAAREIGGITVSDLQFIFKKYLLSLHGAPLHKFQYNPHVIHLAIDPSGGGKGSDWAIMSISIENGCRVVSIILNSHIYFSF